MNSVCEFQSLKMIHDWLGSHVSKAEITQTADGMWQISISASFLVSFFFFFHWKTTLEPLMRQRNYEAWWQLISRINQQNLYRITTFPGTFYPSIYIHSFVMNIFFTWRSHQDANWVYMPIMYVYYEIWLYVDSITQLSSTKALRRVRSW